MQLIPQPTLLDSAALAGAEAAHHFATVLRSQWQAYWSRSPETILADMAANIPQTLAIFALNTQAGLAVNAILDAIADDRFSNRAPVELPAHWSFDGTMFVYAPPAPEVIEEPAE